MASQANAFTELMDTPFPEEILSGHLSYDHPLVGRYATKEMSLIWSPAMKFSTWRKLWVALATAEQELGVEISNQQLEEMRSKICTFLFHRFSTIM
jgi:adenylosuccinate lyase